MKKIVLIRHGQSEYNLKNLFTGWYDCPLSENGFKEAKKAGKLLKEAGFLFDAAYTSVLKRAIDTLNVILNELGQDWVPVEKTWRLNEKHYGALQGLNKKQTAEKYGEEKVLLWRRGFDVRPAPLDKDDDRSPYRDRRYDDIPRQYLPLTESLKDAVERCLPYWQEVIFPSLKNKNQILVNLSKGIELDTLLRMSEVMEQELPDANIAILSGPTLAKEVLMVGTKNKKKICLIFYRELMRKVLNLCFQI